MKQLVLASASPRRKELLESLNYPFMVCPAVGEEVMEETSDPSVLVMKLAEQKAKEVAVNHKGHIVIGADTVVVCQDKVLGKPKTEDEAFSMLKLLENNLHRVYTGVCVYQQTAEGNPQVELFAECTEVHMRGLSDAEINRYIAQGESMDKAGSYGIQGKGALLISRIMGDYYNVMGLPICTLACVLSEKFGLSLFGSGENS